MKEAIDLTWAAMNARLKNLRFGAIGGLASMLALILSAIFIRSWWILAGLPALVLLGVLFTYREHKILFDWEDRILGMWGQSDLCMGILVQTMANYPHALKDSLKSLVKPLPENADYLVPPIDHLKAHRWLFWTRSLAQEIRFARAAAFNLILSCLPVSIWYVSGAGWPWLLLGISPICALPMAETLFTRLALRRWKQRSRTLGEWDRSALPGMQERLAGIDWSRVPGKLKAATTAP